MKRFKQSVAVLLALMMLLSATPLGVLAETASGFASVRSLVDANLREQGGYVVTFVDYDGREIRRFEHQAFNTKVEDLKEQVPVPTRDGWEFVAWKPADVTHIQQDITFTAVYRSLSTNVLRIYYKHKAETGEQAAKTVVRMLPNGAGYEVTSPELLGYHVADSAQLVIRGSVADWGGETEKNYYVIYQPDGNTPYKVVHEVEGLDGGYAVAKTDDLSAETGATVPLIPAAFEGFTANAAFNLTEGLVQPDGSSSFTLRYTRNAYAITYDSRGGSFVAPVAKRFEENIADTDTVPQRQGWTFLHWYEHDEQTPFTFDKMPARDVKLKAKWMPGTADYQVVYWLQDANDPGKYNYHATVRQTGATVGRPIIVQDWEIPAKEVSVGQGKVRIDTGVVERQDEASFVKGDGTAIHNVYVNLKEYTFVFGMEDQTTYSVWPGVKRTGTMDFLGGHYTVSNAYRMKARYGQDISGKWPYPGPAVFTSNDSGSYNFGGWAGMPSGFTQVTKIVKFTEDLLPRDGGSTVNVYSLWREVNKKSVNYWFENTDDDGFTRSETYSQTYYANGNLRPKSIAGMKNIAKPDGFVIPSPYNQDTYNFFYKRNIHTLSFNTMGGTAPAPTQQSVKYGKNVSALLPDGYIENVTAKTVDGVTFLFGGWYKQAEGKDKVDFAVDLMPDSDWELFAKWLPPVHTVTFYTKTMAGDTAVHHTERVEHGQTTAAPADPTRTGYQFAGWRIDANSASPYEFDNMPIMRDTAIYAGWELAANLKYRVVVVLEDAQGHQTENPAAYPGESPKVVGGHMLGQTVVVPAPKWEGYLVDQPMKPLDITDDNLEVRFVYRGFTPTDYYLRLRELGSNILIREDSKHTDSPDVTYVVENPPAVPGYKTVDGTKELALSYNDPHINNVIEFYYIKNAEYAEYKVQHMVENPASPGTYLLADEQIIGTAAGKLVTAETKTYPGYQHDAASSHMSGVTSHTEVITLTVYYTVKRGEITIQKEWIGDDGHTNLRGNVEVELSRDGMQKTVTLEGGNPVTLHNMPYMTITLQGNKPVNAEVATFTAKEISVAGEALVNGKTQHWQATQQTVTGGSENGALTLKLSNTLIKPQYTVHHYLKGTTTRVAQDQTGTLPVGASLSLQAASPLNAPYTKAQLVAGAPTAHTMQATGNEVTLYYQIPVTVTAQNAQKVFGQSDPTLTATVDGTVNSETVAYTVARAEGENVGTYAITPTGEAEQGYYKVTYVPATFTITKANTLTVTAVNYEGTYDGNAHQGGGTASVTEGTAYKYSIDGGNQWTDTVPSIKNVGTVSYRVKAINPNYEDAVADGTLKVNKLEVRVAVSDTNKEYNGQEQQGLQDKEWTGILEGHTATITYTAAKGTKAAVHTGSYADDFKVMAGAENVTGNYDLIVKTAGRLTITKREVTAKVADATKKYTGAEQQGETAVTFTAPVSGHVASITYTPAKGTLPNTYTNGEYANDFKVMAGGEDVTENYTLTEKTAGKLTITDLGENEKLPLEVESKGQTLTYDGQAHTVTGFVKDSYTVNGATFTVEGLTATLTKTNAGTYDNVISGTAKVYDANHTDVTAQFNVTQKVGKLIIKKLSVTASVADESLVYNGKEQQGKSEVVFAVLAEGHTASIGYTPAKGTLVGEYQNGSFADDFTVKAGEEIVTDNYTLTKTAGKLNITDRPEGDKLKLELETNGAEVTYNGKAQKAEGFKTLTFNIDGATFMVKDVTAKVEQTNAGTYQNTIMGTPKVVDANDVDVTSQFTITQKLGELVIRKLSVTASVADESLVYNGKEQQGKSEVVFAALAEGHTASIGYTPAKGTLVGEYQNGSFADDFTVKAGEEIVTDNYTLTKTAGKLNITDRPDHEKFKITVESNSAAFDYDAQPHTVSGFKTLNFTLDGVRYTVEGLTTGRTETNAGTYVNGISGKARVLDQTGHDVTEQFIVTLLAGELAISPIEAAVTVTGNNVTKDYDGSEHKASGYTVAISTDLYKESDFTFIGTAEAKRTDAGTAYMGLKPEQFTNNNPNFAAVTFNVTDGFVKVSPIEATVTVTGNNVTKDYDGSEHKASGYTVAISTDLYKESDFTFSGTAEAKRTDAGTAYMGLKPEQFTNNNPNFAAVTFNVTDGFVKVSPIEATVTVTGSTVTKDYDGSEHKASGYTVAISTDLYKESDFTFSGTAEAKRTDAGTTNMGLKPEQFTNNNPNFAAVTFNVTDGFVKVDPRKVTVTSQSASKLYDGGALTLHQADVTEDGFVGDQGLDLTFTGTQTLPGSSANAFSCVWKANTNENNYDLTVRTGMLTVLDRPDGDKLAIHLTAKSGAVVYNGKEQELGGFTVTGFTFKPKGAAPGAVFTLRGAEASTGKHKDVGVYENAEDLTGAAVLDANGNDVTKQFTVTVTRGQMKITPKALWIISESAQKVYDGKPLTHPVARVEGLIGGDTLTLAFTGRQTKAGETANSFTVRFGKGVRPENYAVTIEFGTLKVTQTAQPRDWPDDVFVIPRVPAAGGVSGVGDAVE